VEINIGDGNICWLDNRRGSGGGMTRHGLERMVGNNGEMRNVSFFFETVSYGGAEEAKLEYLLEIRPAGKQRG
jgi:hypothetical protein